ASSAPTDQSPTYMSEPTTATPAASTTRIAKGTHRYESNAPRGRSSRFCRRRRTLTIDALTDVTKPETPARNANTAMPVTESRIRLYFAECSATCHASTTRPAPTTTKIAENVELVENRGNGDRASTDVRE